MASSPQPNTGPRKADPNRTNEGNRSAQGSLRGIKEHMEVVASCGTKVGIVDRVEGDAIKLTKSASPDGQHHFVPTAWVERVDNQVHLKKNSKETEEGWKPDAASCGCG